jgi:hypothetical protein
LDEQEKPISLSQVGKEGVTMGQQSSIKWHAGMLRSWHLAMLRFAVTRDNADRLGVLAVAKDIDGLGRQEDNAHFGFFHRASVELCEFILNPNKTTETMLQQYLTQIDDPRLRSALAAAIGMNKPAQALARRGVRPKINAIWREPPSRTNLPR